jgi:hypothetical protein
MSVQCAIVELVLFNCVLLIQLQIGIRQQMAAEVVGPLEAFELAGALGLTAAIALVVAVVMLSASAGLFGSRLGWRWLGLCFDHDWLRSLFLALHRKTVRTPARASAP